MRKERGESGRCAHRAENANNLWRGGRTDSVVLANSTNRHLPAEVPKIKRLQKRGIEDTSEPVVVSQSVSQL